MSISDAIYRPFETLIRPLDIPYRPLPSKGPVAVLLHFISMFRGVLIALALSSMAIEAINLTIVWGLSVIVDGVSQKGASAFLHSEWPLLTFLGLLIFPAMPVASFLLNTLNSHTLGVGMPAAIQWQGHKAVERQDLAFFHDLFAGQVASRLSQVASAVQQQIIAAFQSIPRFLLQMVGSVILLSALSWQLALPVVVWIALNVALAVKMAPIFVERSRRTAKQRSLVAGAITDLYTNMQMIKQFAAEDSEAGAIRRIIRKAIQTQHREQRIYRTLGTDCRGPEHGALAGDAVDRLFGPRQRLSHGRRVRRRRLYPPTAVRRTSSPSCRWASRSSRRSGRSRMRCL